MDNHNFKVNIDYIMGSVSTIHSEALSGEKGKERKKERKGKERKKERKGKERKEKRKGKREERRKRKLCFPESKKARRLRKV